MDLAFRRDGASVRLGDAPRDRDHADRAAAAAMPPRTCKVDGEAEAFCGTLAALPTLDYRIARAVIPALPLPGGYEHFRLFEAGESVAFHRCFTDEPDAERATLHDVLFGVLEWPCMEVTRWTGTRLKADSIPGVLDIEVDIDARPGFRPLRLRP